jgi:acyl dehydratase
VQHKIVAGDKLHHEDLEVGRAYTSGTWHLTKEEIIAFGRAYDPQPIHVDEEAAKAALVGGLCASGYHVCAIMMRLVCDAVLNRVESLGSPGIDEARWFKPLRPGDTVHVTYTVQEKRVLASRPDVGMAKVLVELHGADGSVIANWVTNQLTRMRTPGVPPGQPASPRVRQAAFNLWEPSDPDIAVKGDVYFEEREIGETFNLGAHPFGRDEIIAFARQWDPQPFHLDEKAAAASLFGQLAASGWHTCAMYIRGLVGARQKASAEARAHGLQLAAYGPSPGFKSLSWPKPVFAGDTVEFRSRLTQKVDLKSRPERGLLVFSSQGRNQHGELVFQITTQLLAQRREPYRAT